MKKIVFLKTFIETRWCHRFRSKETLEKYQKKQLARYHSFINELNTLGVDRDQALEMAIRGEQTRDFTEMNGEVAVGLSSGTSGHRGIFVTTEKERSMWAAAILAKMLPKGNLFGHRIAFSYERITNSIKPLIRPLFD